jgi:hypothetical protein
VPRPIGEKMQRRSPAAFSVLDHTMGEPGIGCEQPTQPVDLAVLECRCELDAKRLVTSERATTRHRRPVYHQPSRRVNPPKAVQITE